MTVWTYMNTDTAHLLPTIFVRKRPFGFGFGWIYRAIEFRFPERAAAQQSEERK